MFDKLHVRLTAICTLITGIILICMAACSLYISESQLNKQIQTTFQNNINSIVYKIQSGKIIDNVWLSQIEAGNSLIIHIEDNTIPITFSGSWKPPTDRKVLILRAQQEALSKHNFDIKLIPLSVLKTSSVSFELKGDNNERYLASLISVPSSNGWQGLTILHDMRTNDKQILLQRILFTSLVVASIFFLFVFSWWFARRSIKPIEESNNRQIEFVASASHELRSPLAVLQTSTEALEISTTQADREKFTSTIKKECFRMGRLVDDLLLLSSADCKTWSVNTEKINIETLLTDIYDNFQHAARCKNHKLHLNLPDKSLPVINCDAVRIQQAISILVANAIDYTQCSGEISIEAEYINHIIKIKVSDNGLDISEEDKAHIFDRFYRADKSRNKKDHYGLGLSVAKEIAKLHSANIYVQDTKGGGSTFIIELPLNL